MGERVYRVNDEEDTAPNEPRELRVIRCDLKGCNSISFLYAHLGTTQYNWYVIQKMGGFYTKYYCSAKCAFAAMEDAVEGSL